MCLLNIELNLNLMLLLHTYTMCYAYIGRNASVDIFEMKASESVSHIKTMVDTIKVTPTARNCAC